MEGKKIKIFLNNGYCFEGFEKERNDLTLLLLDVKTNKVMELPFTSISTIEVVE